MDKFEYLSRLSHEDSKYLEAFVSDIVEFSTQKENRNLFSTCGLYAVGSSLTSDSPNDLDVALVGLDFKSVFHYTGRYLEDIPSLIEGKLLVPAEDLAYNPERVIIPFEGKEYTFNNHYFGYSMHQVCSTDISPSTFVMDLMRYLHKRNLEDLKDVELHSTGRDLNPLFGYNTDSESHIVVRQRFGRVDFIVHAENLLPEYWKHYQKMQGLPYAILQEWDKVRTADFWKRPMLFAGSYPDFIDYSGKERPTRTGAEPRYSLSRSP